MAPIYPCIVCARAVRSNSLAVSCDVCDNWCHIRCGTDISKDEYLSLQKESDFFWICIKCRRSEMSAREDSFMCDMHMSETRNDDRYACVTTHINVLSISSATH